MWSWGDLSPKLCHWDYQMGWTERGGWGVRVKRNSDTKLIHLCKADTWDFLIIHEAEWWRQLIIWPYDHNGVNVNYWSQNDWIPSSEEGSVLRQCFPLLKEKGLWKWEWSVTYGLCLERESTMSLLPFAVESLSMQSVQELDCCLTLYPKILFPKSLIVVELLNQILVIWVISLIFGVESEVWLILVEWHTHTEDFFEDQLMTWIMWRWFYFLPSALQSNT